MSGYIPRKRKCGSCDGTGKIRRNVSTLESYTFHKVDCDVCSGAGFLLSKQRNQQRSN